MKKAKIVNSSNEWDTLEEVIVGRIENAMFPSWDYILKNTIPKSAIHYYENVFSMKGKPIPEKIIAHANDELNKFISILKEQGVKVKRPEIFNFQKEFKTPDWQVKNGVSSANPRDVFLIIDDLIIECPMADRGRYFEMFPYRKIMTELFHEGARWISAPKPMLRDKLYNDFKKRPKSFCINNIEPTFDAADFIRCGKNIIGQLSQVTNLSGVKWLQSIIGNKYNIHLIDSKCTEALHIDTTIMPLEEGVLLINPEFISENDLPECFKHWEIIYAPKPASFTTEVGDYKVVSDWMSMNMLNIGEKRVIVEEKQKDMIKLLKEKGFHPIPCPFESYYIFGGSFHCATLDIRRNTK